METNSFKKIVTRQRIAALLKEKLPFGQITKKLYDEKLITLDEAVTVGTSIYSVIGKEFGVAPRKTRVARAVSTHVSPAIVKPSQTPDRQAMIELVISAKDLSNDQKIGILSNLI